MIALVSVIAAVKVAQELVVVAAEGIDVGMSAEVEAIAETVVSLAVVAAATVVIVSRSAVKAKGKGSHCEKKVTEDDDRPNPIHK